jgi:FAD/FMN-containing dehydrogenase
MPTPWPGPPPRWCAWPIQRSGEGFVAISPEARKKFWLDRKRTAAISKHTNAFKINEDVVIPLPRMAEYTDGIERINIELSLRNKLRLADDADWHFLPQGNLPLGKQRRRRRNPLGRAAGRPRGSRPGAAARGACAVAGLAGPGGPAVPAVAGPHPARQLEDADPRAAGNIFAGDAFKPILDECNAIHKRVLKGRVWVALHMHAGDGNVHTNIPVNSDDYDMLQTAHEAVKRIMALARSLDGVISGEHGIGITKLEFLTDDELQPVCRLQAPRRPRGPLQQGQAAARSGRQPRRCMPT